MTLHISRDFFVNSGSSISNDKKFLYLTSIFLYGTLGFNVVGSTGFNLTSSFLYATGSSGSINLGPGQEYQFTPASGTFPISGVMVGGILVLKSDAYPRCNSGLFKITSATISNNSYTIDYRSTSYPPVEVNTLTWSLFHNELSASSLNNTTDNGAAYRYKSNSTASVSRIVLQSPHSTAWQVRLCFEHYNDLVTGYSTIGPKVSIAPGFGGNYRGDFSPQGRHLHTVQWWDRQARYNDTDVWSQRWWPALWGSVLGMTNGTADGRLYFWGNDDPSGSINIIWRTSDSTMVGQAAFGFTDNCIVNDSDDLIHRMFVFGQGFDPGNPQDFGDECKWRTLRGANSVTNMILTYGLSNKPCVGGLGMYGYYKQGISEVGPSDAGSNANDCPFINATELYAPEINRGVAHGMGDNSSDVAPKKYFFEIEPTTLGSFPNARAGRTNFTTFTTSSNEGNNWLHFKNGVYLPWTSSIGIL